VGEGPSPLAAGPHDPACRALRAVFGQRSQLWRDLTARQSLEVLRDMYSLRESDYRERIKEFNRILELEEFWDAAPPTT
jgi:ABC-2 type transport system ATP-binding protein